MNDWSIVIGVITIMGILFGIFWKILADVKSSSHARMNRIETEISKMKTDCNIRLTSFANKDDVEKIEHHVDTLNRNMNTQFSGLTTRIDSLLLHFTKNGAAKT
jgi:hypothetical protein